MNTASISELKARLSEYLSQVKAGMEVLITDRGKPVARLVPVTRNKDFKESLIRMKNKRSSDLDQAISPGTSRKFLDRRTLRVWC